MKKVIGLVFAIMMVFSSFEVTAEEWVYKEFEFGAAAENTQNKNASDEVVLLEDVFEIFEQRLKEAWTNLEAEVDISDLKISTANIGNMYGTVWFENPQFYFVERVFSGSYNDSNLLMGAVKPKYVAGEDKATVKAMWARFDEAREEILLCIDSDMTDMQKITTVHDYMALNYKYNLQNPDQTMKMLAEKNGVCAGYAFSFKYIMKHLGIECDIIESEAMKHMWNIVKVEGKWYHVDVTHDDPLMADATYPDRAAMVSHSRLLLSTEELVKIVNMDGYVVYYDFDVSGYEVGNEFDDAPWRSSECAIAAIGSTLYYVDGKNLVDDKGNIIFENLDGGDKIWDAESEIWFNEVMSGICELNGKLYFNTEDGIYSYDPDSEKTEFILEQRGICGIYADKNVLMYNKYDEEHGSFVEGGSLRIADYRLAEPYMEGEKAVVRLYNDSVKDIVVYSKGDGIKVYRCDETGVEKIEFDNGNVQEIFIWDEDMQPLMEKTLVQ